MYIFLLVMPNYEGLKKVSPKWVKIRRRKYVSTPGPKEGKCMIMKECRKWVNVTWTRVAQHNQKRSRVWQK